MDQNHCSESLCAVCVAALQLDVCYNWYTPQLTGAGDETSGRLEGVSSNTLMKKTHSAPLYTCYFLNYCWSHLMTSCHSALCVDCGVRFSNHLHRFQPCRWTVKEIHPAAFAVTNLWKIKPPSASDKIRSSTARGFHGHAEVKLLKQKKYLVSPNSVPTHQIWVSGSSIGDW